MFVTYTNSWEIYKQITVKYVIFIRMQTYDVTVENIY